MSDESQAGATDEEEPFISASLTSSKAASLPKNIAESAQEPSSSQATLGSKLAISPIEKLDSIESFMEPLMKEAIKKAKALLKIQDKDSICIATSDPIMNWLHSADMKLPPSITEVPHPLASLSTLDAEEELPNPVEAFTLECSIANGLTIKEEPSTPELSTSTTSMGKISPPQVNPSVSSPPSKGNGEAGVFPKRPLPIGASGPIVAPHKSKSKVQDLLILCSAFEVPLEVKLLASGKKPSTPQNLVVRYNPRASHVGGLCSGSIEVKEFYRFTPEG